MNAEATPPMSYPSGGPQRLPVTLRDRRVALEAVDGALERRDGFALATLNLDHLVKLRRDPAFRRAYLETDFVVADGTPVMWLSRLAGRPVGLAPGSELVEPCCALAARRNAPVALFGATEDTLERAAERLCATHPGLTVALRIAPPFGFDPTSEAADAYAKRIAESGAGLCFLALGAPKQEVFAARARRAAPHCGFLSIGAGLDFIAGAQTRAPVWVRRIAMEWLWRMMSDPRRLARRYLDCALILPGLAADAWRLRAEESGR